MRLIESARARRVVVAVLAGLLGGLVTGADSAQAAVAQANGPELFRGVPAPTGRVAERPEPVRRLRHVRVDIDRLRSETTGPGVELNLLAGVRPVAIRSLVRPDPLGTLTWEGDIVDDPEGFASLVVSAGTVSGDVRYRDRVYLIRHVEDGVHAVMELDPAALGRRADDARTPPPYAVGASGPRANAAGGAAGIDLLVVYTAAARAGAGGTGAIQGEIQNAVNQSNAAYAATDAGIVLNLVDTLEVDYSAGSLGGALDDLTNDGDGEMDEVHGLRDQVGADVVALIVENASGGTIGIAWQMGRPSAGFASHAFSVTVRHWAAGPEYVLAHEIGHNLGMAHDRYVDPFPGAYEYSHGFSNLDSDNPFKTVMSYDDACFDAGLVCPTVRAVSSPAYTHGGQPMGLGQVDPESADNALTGRNVGGVVAGFRSGGSGGGGGGGDQTLPAPTGLTGSVTESALSLSWNPVDGSDVSYRVEVGRSSGSADYSLTTVAGTTETLSNVPDDTYYARVRARNGAGLSPPSNEVAVTVDTRVEPPGVPRNLSVEVEYFDATFRWRAPGDGGPASGYRLEIGTAPGRADAAERIATDTRYVLNGIPDGEYFAQLVATNGGGASDPTEPIEFTLGIIPVVPEPPGPTVPIGPSETIDAVRPEFRWESAERAVSYEFLLRDDDEEIHRDRYLAAEVCDNDACAIGAPPEIAFDVAPVSYKWRVRAWNGAGNGGYDGMRFRVVDDGGPPDEIELLRPLRFASRRDPDLQWAADPRASHYELEVMRRGEIVFQSRVSADEACGSMHTCGIPAGSGPEELANGEHRWSVQGVNGQGPGPAASTVFRVRPHRLPRPPRLLSPEQDETTSEYPVLRWRGGEYANGFLLELTDRRDGRMTRYWIDALEACRGMTDCRIGFAEPGLAGSYYEWRVVGGRSEDKLGRPSPIRRLTVVPGTTRRVATDAPAGRSPYVRLRPPRR